MGSSIKFGTHADAEVALLMLRLRCAADEWAGLAYVVDTHSVGSIHSKTGDGARVILPATSWHLAMQVLYLQQHRAALKLLVYEPLSYWSMSP
jgi:hypothetical protein